MWYSPIIGGRAINEKDGSSTKQYGICKFLVVISGAVLGILSGIVFLASLVLFFTVGLWAGLSWMVIAFLISPYGLPMLAAGLTGMIGSANCALRDFIFG